MLENLDSNNIQDIDVARREIARLRDIIASLEQDNLQLRQGQQLPVRESSLATPSPSQDLTLPDEPTPRQILIRAFTYLQKEFALGIGELQAALRAAEGGWDADRDDLAQAARLLWCNSFEQELEFKDVWTLTISELSAQISSGEKREPFSTPSSPPDHPEHPDTPPPPPPSPPKPKPKLMEQPAPEWTVLPIHAPFVPVLVKGKSDLQTYWPVSRRFMIYGWRYLRRPIPDGPKDVLDIQTTVEKAAQQGFFIAPVYRRRERNHAHLILLLDQGGSMTPFHRYVRDVVETAQHESTIKQVDTFYFHDVPADSVYLDPHLTKTVLLEDHVLKRCSSGTSVLIVSDAGAARGHRQLDRIRLTTEFLSRLKQHTMLIAWLNPMPMKRWEGTSAQIIAHLIPMSEMNLDGFSMAIDNLRGQSPRRYR